MKANAVAIAILVAAALGGTAFAQMGMMGHGPGMRGAMMGNQVYRPRHFDYMHGQIPKAYRGKTNPLHADAATLALGRKLYAENCAACHGPEGDGDGEAGKSLSPPPANLQWTLSTPIGSDGFLYWSISEGGTKYKTAMPAFKASMKPGDIWAIVTALRSGELK